jgi:glycosyltransferase involved in cell wall biosynthesis
LREDGPAVLIGPLNTIWLNELASRWRSRGIPTVVVTYRWSGGSSLPDGTPVLSSFEHESNWSKRQLSALNWILRQIERVAHVVEKKRYSRVMVPAGRNDYLSLAQPIVFGISIPRLVRSLKPRFVYGHEVSTYGLATARCRGFPRILQPWGGDIHERSDASSFIKAIVKYALRHVDLVCPGSITATKYVIDQFGVSPSRAHYVSWGVDRSMFYRADDEKRQTVCAKYGVDPTAMIFMNVRRFRPPWGCDIVLNAFIRFASEWPQSNFVLLGGAKSEPYVLEARKRLAETHLEKRFTFFDGEIPLADCAELMSVADVFTSIVRRRDIGSWGVIQAAAAGSAPILSDHSEYREMVHLGFKALFVDINNEDTIITAMQTYAEDENLRSSTANRNQQYISQYEDYERQITKLLELIDQASRRTL